jgi:molybdopterin-containing oxidoreductase family iron-sulfur binding subunit
MRGVVEKCTFCHHRLLAARSKAYLDGANLDEVTYTPACVEACPTKAIVFGNLRDPNSEVAKLARDPRAFRILSRLNTEPKVYYLSRYQWVHKLGDKGL